MTNQYIHGYDPGEQHRLVLQAEVLEPILHRGLHLDQAARVLEIGCGVGAQLRILAEKFPHARFWGVDIAEENCRTAESRMRDFISRQQVTILQVDGRSLPFGDGSFDQVLVIFVLEHVADPLEVLREAHRVLRTDGSIHCVEVVNSNLLACPPSAVINEYWHEFNALQRESGGDPDVGFKLGALLHRAGFREVELHDASVVLDERVQDPRVREAIVDNFVGVFLSAHEKLAAKGVVSRNTGVEVRREFAKYREDVGSVFSYGARRATGRKTTG